MESVRLPILRLPRAQIRSQTPDEDPDFDDPNLEGPDLEGPNFEEDDSELDPTDDSWDLPDFDADDEEPEPEYGDFWQEPDDFED